MHVLVANVVEQLVLDDGTTGRKPGVDAMQLRILLVRRDIAILLEEEGRRVQEVGSPTDVGSAVEAVGAGGSAEVDVRAAGGTLLCVIHGGVDADFFESLRCWGR